MTLASPAPHEDRVLFRYDNMIHLLSYRSFSDLLQEALAMAVNTFRAKGGSLLYASSLVQKARQGTFPPQVRERVDAMERAYHQRLEHGGRQIQFPTSPPVTRHDLAHVGGHLFTAPLVNYDRTCGLISLFLPHPLDLDHQQTQDLSWFAGALSAITTNVEQLDLTRQRLSQLGLFYQMGQAMTSTFDTGHLFQDTIDLALTVTDAQQAKLLLVEDKEVQLRHKMSRGGAIFPKAECVPLGEGIVGAVAKHGQPVLANDPLQDERFDLEIDAFQDQPIQNLICVPLQIKGVTIGVLEICNKHHPYMFGQEDLSVLITLAAQVSIALENARLYNSLRSERDRVIEAQESTRRELARNLHDGPVQLLAAIAMELEFLERVAQVKPDAIQQEIDSLRKLVRQATQDARLLLFELRPIILETQGLVPALHSYIERLEENGRFEPHFEGGDLELDIQASIAGTIFSIVQEAITNIEKHAEADHVWIRLRKEQNELIVVVEDDGKGFDVESVIGNYDQGNSFGLLNMRERAALIDGVLVLDSKPHRQKPGTMIELRVALEESGRANDD